TWFLPRASFLFFFPVFVITLYYLVQNYRRIEGDKNSLGIPLIMFALGFRWTSSITTFLIARRISAYAFAFMLYFAATVSVILCYVLAARAFLKYQLFRVRGLVADIVLYAGFAVMMIGILYAGVEMALTRASGPMQLRAMLIALAFVPLALYGMKSYILP